MMSVRSSRMFLVDECMAILDNITTNHIVVIIVGMTPCPPRKYALVRYY